MAAEGFRNTSPDKRRLNTHPSSRSLTPGYEGSRRLSTLSVVREVSRLRLLDNEMKLAEKDDMTTSRNVHVSFKDNKVAPMTGGEDTSSQMEVYY